MKGDKKVIQTLNLSLKGELTAINQYFLHARIFESWGVTKLAKHEKAESIEEMGHADQLIQRILLLEGLPNLQDLDKLMIGETVKEALEADMKLEKTGIANYRKGIVVCEEAQDYVTRDLLIKILADEEGHLDHVETQLKMIEDMGLENYLLLQSDSIDQQG
ncbi:MAG: bacterioferritin [Alphaproteobacteria bacterium]|nr:bacterioferritin [Alphaproteobacteria bacterium]